MGNSYMKFSMAETDKKHTSPVFPCAGRNCTLCLSQWPAGLFPLPPFASQQTGTVCFNVLPGYQTTAHSSMRAGRQAAWYLPPPIPAAQRTLVFLGTQRVPRPAAGCANIQHLLGASGDIRTASIATLLTHNFHLKGAEDV